MNASVFLHRFGYDSERTDAFIQSIRLYLIWPSQRSRVQDSRNQRIAKDGDILLVATFNARFRAYTHSSKAWRSSGSLIIIVMGKRRSASSVAFLATPALQIRPHISNIQQHTSKIGSRLLLPVKPSWSREPGNPISITAIELYHVMQTWSNKKELFYKLLRVFFKNEYLARKSTQDLQYV